VFSVPLYVPFEFLNLPVMLLCTKSVWPAASAIDDETSVIEQSDADPRACAALEPDGIASHVERQSVEPPHARCDRECNLGARAETGMSGDDLVDSHVTGVLDVESALHRLQIASDPLVFGTGHSQLRSRVESDAGLESVDREADAPESTSETSVEIQKAEMEPRRNRNCNARGGRGAVQPFSPEIFP